MSNLVKYPEITDDDVATVEEFLSRNIAGEIRNFETLDGFLTALIIGPDFVAPSQFMPVITSSSTDNVPIFNNEQEFKCFYDVLMRHWNHINEKYNNDEIYMLYLAEDDQGEVKGNDWATGFLRGTELHRGTWAELLNSDELSGPLMPIFALKYENSEDKSLRPFKDPVTKEQRNKLITSMVAGVKQLYDIFREEEATFGSSERMPSRSKEKIGRNDLCPCGSGKKFKKCCALKTFH
jgi:uncharacterized protein